MKRPAKAQPRGGIVDLALVVLVVLAAWTRTPIGLLGEYGWAMARGQDAEFPSLIARFATGPEAEVVARIEARVAVPIGALPDGAFPEPYRTAAMMTLSEEVPEASRHLLAELGPATGQEAVLAVLDRLHVSNPEFTLEVYAIGHEQRRRAVDRARAAGEEDPDRYDVHRRYLPAADAQVADAIVSATMGAGAMLSLAWPIAGEHRISSPYGYRVHPVLKRKKLHNGVDLAVPVGTPVLSAQDGTVSVATEDNLNGKYLVIDHGHGVRSSYCHLSALEADKGDEVTRGQQVALSGNTGRSTGPHLHFTLKVSGKTVDPEKFRPPPPPES